MTRLILLAVLLAGCATSNAVTPHRYEALPSAAFSPLVRPNVPGRGEHPEGPGACAICGGRQTRSESQDSTPPPSVRPLRTAIPATRSVSGVATYYDYHQGQAAAARALRAFLGSDWRDSVVRVLGPLGALNIRLTDYESSAIPNRLIDLDRDDWITLCGNPSRGVCQVTVVK